MDVIRDMINDIRSAENALDWIMLRAVRSRESEVISLNVDDQLFQGIGANGERIRPPYAPATVRIKRRKGQPYDRVTLRDTGDYHESFFLIYRDDEFEFDAKDPKKKWLERRYKKKSIYGLTDQNVGRVIGLIGDDVVVEFRKSVFK